MFQLYTSYYRNRRVVCVKSQIQDNSNSVVVPLMSRVRYYLLTCTMNPLVQTLDDKNRPLAFTDGAGEISPEVAKLIGGLSPPSLVQHRTYKSGMTLKGTYQVNHKVGSVLPL